MSAALQRMLDLQYGHPPPEVAVTADEIVLAPASWAGGRREVRRLCAGNKHANWSTDLLLQTPEGSGPFPLLIGLNFHGLHTVTDDPTLPMSLCAANGLASRGMQARRWDLAQATAAGLAVATLHADAVCWDSADPAQRAAHTGVGSLFAGDGIGHGPSGWGAIAAWAWALRHAATALRRDSRIDAARVGMCGHSRLGKAALLAAALDPAVALVIDNQSGTCGGAPSVGKPADAETTEHIQGTFPHWFCPTFAAHAPAPETLPFAQADLLRAIAPRPLLMTYAACDRWADPDGARANRDSVAPYWTDPARVRFVLRDGSHDVLPTDWTTWIDFCRCVQFLP